MDEKEIYFVPTKKGKEKSKKINLHISSSTVKTFFSLVFHLRHIAKIGDYLIIDEPELNLHPDNQRKIARVLAKMVNRGINVIISTHSDYIIKEINNLIMLKSQFEGREQLLKKYSYKEDELLDISDISPYLFKNNTLELMEINREEGIIAETFDDVINTLNRVSDEIYYTIQGEQ